MPPRYRLYLALSQRHGLPGFDWSILLATHDDVSQTLKADEPDATRWHLLSEHPPDTERPDHVRNGPWHRREDQINQVASLLIGRFLLAKISAVEHAAAVARIQAAVEQIPLEGGCQLWTLRAVQVLQAARIISLAADVRNSADLEQVVLAAGEEVVERIQRRELEIRVAKDIPTGELRKGWWRKIV